MFATEILDDLGGIFANVCTDFEAKRVELDDADDNVHLLVNYPEKVAVFALANSLKGVNNRPTRLFQSGGFSCTAQSPGAGTGEWSWWRGDRPGVAAALGEVADIPVPPGGGAEPIRR